MRVNSAARLAAALAIIVLFALGVHAQQKPCVTASKFGPDDQVQRTYKATGKSFKANFALVWKICEGKAVRFVQYVDTLLVQRALQA